MSGYVAEVACSVETKVIRNSSGYFERDLAQHLSDGWQHLSSGIDKTGGCWAILSRDK